MLRVPVRIAGLLLIAIGSLLWLRARLVAPMAHPVAVAVVPSVRPVTKRHRHAETPLPKPSSEPAAAPSPTHVPLSKVDLVLAQGRHYRFEVDLHKSDGWYDTGIPVTAGLRVITFCGLKLQASRPACDHWVQAMVGGKIFRPPLSESNGQAPINVEAVLPNQVPENPNIDPALLLRMPDGSSQTLKLMVSGENTPEEMDGYIVTIYVRLEPGSQAGQYTTSQQVAREKLATWVVK